jgi:Ricin-type beta-trefoil lectin domain-like
MSNGYWLTSLGSGLVMDVTGAKITPGTSLEVWTKNPPGDGTPNQLWTFDPGPGGPADFFFIKSNLGDNLFVDVQDAKATPGTRLDTWPQKSGTDADNQLWKWVPLSGSPEFPSFPAFGSFQSLLAPNLVIDVTGGNKPAGTPLEVWTKNPGFTGNQTWSIIASPGNSYDAKITGIDFAGDSGQGANFNIVGAGFAPLTPVIGNFLFTTTDTGDPVNGTAGEMFGGTDLAGRLAIGLEIDTWDGTPGTLQIKLSLSEPLLPNGGEVSSYWDGSNWGPIR